MLLTVNQVTAIEIAILIIYFCYKDTRRGNVTKGKKEKGKLSEQNNQDARLPKQNKKWTEGRKRKNKQESYHFEYIRDPMSLRQNQKSTLLNNQVKRNQTKCLDPNFHRSNTPKVKTVNNSRRLHISSSLKAKA